MSSEGNIGFPPEIMTSILHRLPVKSLGRFKCVSKDWLSLISDPQFIKIHHTSHIRNHLIFVSNDHSLYTLPFHHHEPDSLLLLLKPKKLQFNSDHVYGCCNGLVLVSAHNLDSLVILNPTTMEIMELPESDYEVINNWSEIEIVYGFGYDSLSDDYKVVTMSYFHNQYLIPPDTISVHVYSLRTNTWRWVIDSPPYDFSSFVSGVFVNGCLHWIATRLLPSQVEVVVIIAFSLADETFIRLPVPMPMPSSNLCNDSKLVLLDGKLAIFMEGEVWLMNQYGIGESWTKISIPMLDLELELEPVLLDEDGKILLVNTNRMLIYDIQESRLCKSVNTFKDFKVRGTYVESLVSPKFKEADTR